VVPDPKHKNVNLVKVDLPPYGTHHTKMMLLLYKAGLRVVILTANLLAQDWGQKTQGFWMSPIFPKSNETDSSEFNRDLVQYLSAYKRKALNQWVEVIKSHDMSSANVVLIGSVPGRHIGHDLSTWGHMRLRKVLKNKMKKIDSSWPVIGQFSSIGSLGPTNQKWLCSEWLTSMGACNHGNMLGLHSNQPPLKLVFPSVDDVRGSLEGYPAGASIPYGRANEAKQKWVRGYMHRWIATHSGRSPAAPHMKTYARVSPYETNIRLSWFLLTSANLSKAAWGALEKNKTQLSIKSFELGVLFLPPKSGPPFFYINSSQPTNQFPYPITLPLTPYGPQDEPWVWDSPHTDAPDRHGNMWVPS
uniref:Tyrosyl-DNA phosphodiesterase 1 n=1 Tax=Ciona savignyi TaxID=51511 RepID=H2Y640_CIOSA